MGADGSTRLRIPADAIRNDLIGIRRIAPSALRPIKKRGSGSLRTRAPFPYTPQRQQIDNLIMNIVHFCFTSIRRTLL